MAPRIKGRCLSRAVFKSLQYSEFEASCIQRADNQINRHDVAGVPDDRAQVKHLVELEPAENGIRLAQRKAHSAGDIRGTSARDKNGRSRAHCGSRP